MAKKTHCSRSAASYIPILSVLESSIESKISPDTMPALYAGPPGAAEITTSPEGDWTRPGYPIDKPTPVRAPWVPDCLE